ncbi:MAG: T9SS type A sorting domain-containing protein [Porphyromonadaceae bacterium]|nr:T9SS type A sorting domain-containing protein [Porphyromonadaceae bacterium]
MDRYSKILGVAVLCLGLLFPLTRALTAQNMGSIIQFGYADRDAAKVSLGTERTSFISVGMRLPKMQGNVLKGLSLYLAGAEGEQGDQHSVFIASSTDNQIKYIQSVSLTAGWNEVAFTQPFLMKDDTYYIGYQLQARVGKKPIAFEQVSGGKISGVDFIEIGGVYQEVGDLVDFALVKDENLGNVLLFAHVEDRIGRLTNTGCVVSGGFASEELTGGQEHILTLKVRNLGSRAISTLDMTTQFGIEAEHAVSLTNLNIPAGQAQDVMLKVIAPRRGLGVFYASAKKVNGKDNLFADIKYELPYKVKTANASWPRKTVLVERFTTERCLNCPASEPHFKSLVAHMEREGMEVSVIAHHAGYYTDAFTIGGSRRLVPYAYRSSEFAPAFMINRMPDVARVGFLAGDYRNPVERYAKAKEVQEVLSFTSVKATEENGALTLRIEGEVGQIDQENLFLTAVITEDHIRAINQAGATGVFYHHHLARQFLTSEYGRPIKLNPDGTFSLEIGQVQIDPLWKKENLRFVILAHKDIRSSDYTQREVYSSKTVSWSAALTSVNEIVEDVSPRVFALGGYLHTDVEVDELHVFDMAGRLVTRSHAQRLISGVYVVRLGRSGKYTTYKVLVD